MLLRPPPPPPPSSSSRSTRRNLNRQAQQPVSRVNPFEDDALSSQSTPTDDVLQLFDGGKQSAYRTPSSLDNQSQLADPAVDTDFLDIFGLEKVQLTEKMPKSVESAPETSSDGALDTALPSRKWSLTDLLHSPNGPTAQDGDSDLQSRFKDESEGSHQSDSDTEEDNQEEEHRQVKALPPRDPTKLLSLSVSPRHSVTFSSAIDEPHLNVGEFLRVDAAKLKEKLSQPLPPDAGKMSCYLVVSGSSYQLFSEEDNRFIMAAKRVSKLASVTPSYHISTRLDCLDPKSCSYLGRLSGNLLGSDYNLYDGGLAPEKAAGILSMRKQLCAVQYATTRMQGVPRQMKIHIPKVQSMENGIITTASWRPKTKREYMQVQGAEGTHESISLLVNKSPVWNESLESYCLDFGGRVTMACVGNFLLVDPAQEDQVVMLFGQVATNKFSCDFRYPLSPLQAFAIALSAVNSKIVCE